MAELDPTWVDEAAGWAGSYIHIPFCATVCPYCDFAVVEGRDDMVRRYIDAVLAEIGTEPPWRELDSVFVGGGTPSHIEAALLGELLAALRNRFGIVAHAEITLEANPEDWSPGRAHALRAAGFNRVSFGAQSLDSDVLDFLGRRHGPADVTEAVRVARGEGFASVSVDLILGSPIESFASWQKTVDGVIELEVDHVSTYELTVERGTPFGLAVEKGAPGPDPDDQADKYEYARQALSAVGLMRYEVSSYARAGHECRYNLTVWAHGEYLAFGMGAHGHREGIRTWRVGRLQTYVHRIEEGESPVEGHQRLTGDERERERIMVGVGRSVGVAAGAVGRHWLRGAEARRMVQAGIVADRVDRIVVEQPLLTDTVVRSILAPDEP